MLRIFLFLSAGRFEMLSERAFARSFPVFWSSIAPRLDFDFLQDMGEPTCPFRNRWDDTFQGTVPAKQNDLVAEMAFGLFCASLSHDVPPEALPALEAETAFRQASQRIGVLRRLPIERTLSWTTEHTDDARALAGRLRTHIASPAPSIVIQPYLPGFGMLNACYADLASGDELIEVKMGAAPFRLQDVRQLLIYCILAHASGVLRIGACSLVNPRIGLTWRFAVPQLIEQISDLSPADFFETFVRFIDPQEVL